MPGPKLHGVQAEGQAALADRGGDVPGRGEHGPALAVQQEGEELGGLGVLGAAGSTVEAEGADPVGRQGGREGLPDGVQFAQVAGGLRLSLARSPQHLLDQTGPPLGGPEDEGQEDVVHEELPGLQLLSPLLVEVGAEGLLRRRRELRGDPPSNHVVPEGEPRGGGAAQHRLADGLSVVEVLVRRRLEGKARDVQGLDQQPVPGRHRLGVQVPGIGQAVGDGGLPGRQEAGGLGRDEPVHGVYEFPPQKLKFRTRGQDRTRVIQMSKKRGSRTEPA